MRIASLLPSATDWVCCLGAADELVGRSHECAVPGREVPVLTRPAFVSSGDSAEIDRAVQNALQKGLSLYEVDMEALRRLRPDVILTQTQCEVCAVSQAQLEKRLAEELEPAPELVSIAPMTLKQVLDAGLRIGRVTGRVEEAMAFVAEKERELRVLHERLRFLDRAEEERPCVVCIEWLEPLMTAGHWMPDVVEQAGGRSVLAECGARSRAVDWEALRTADPDVVLVMPCGFQLDETLRDLDYLTRRPGWDELAAVGHGRVFLLDGHTYFNRPGPSIYRAIELVAHCLYPEHEIVEPEEWEVRRLSGSITRN